MGFGSFVKKGIKKAGKVGGAVTGTMLGGPVGTYLGSKAGGVAGEIAANPGQAGDILGRAAGKVTTAPKTDLNQLELDKIRDVPQGAGRLGGQIYDWQRQGQEYQQRQGPQAQGFSPEAQDQMRTQQMALVNALQNRAAGNAPSAAEMQLQMGMDRNVAGARSAAASAQGLNPALAARMAAQGAGQAGMQMNQQAAMLRAQEQAQAENALGSALSGFRGQDLQLGDLQNRLGVANMNAELQQGGMNDQILGRYLDIGQGRDELTQRGGLDAAGLGINRDLGISGLRADVLGADVARQADREKALIGGLFGAAGSAGAAALRPSDRRLKKGIKKAGVEVDNFLSALKAEKYKYKNERHGEGERFSVMAQDLEKTKIGRSFVRNTPEGKIVDYGAGLGAMLASQAHLHKKLKKLERGAA